jgi:hypothetical protein
VFPGFPGYATGEVGFHSAAFDQPTNDFFQLSPAADFTFILLAKDDGMEVWNDHGSAYMGVGEAFFIGIPPFDSHPVWDLVSGVPGRTYALTLKLHDLNGVYTDSTPIVLSFTPEPPLLTIGPGPAGFVNLSWTPSAPGLVLQSTSTLAPPTWTTEPTGATNPVTLPLTSGVKFFRLRKSG